MRPGAVVDEKLRTYRAIQDAFVHKTSFPFPLVVEIEPSTDCNLHCRFCPRERLSRPKGHLSSEDCETIVRNLGAPSFPCMLLYSGFGEPMLNAALASFVAVAKKQGWTCGVTTNGSLLSCASIEPLLDAGLDILQVSLHAATERTYHAVVEGGSFHDTVKGIRSILPLCKERRVVVAMNYTVCPSNRQEMGRFVKTWKEQGVDCVNVSVCHNRGGFLGDASSYGNAVPPGLQGRACWIRLHAAYVAWNGDLLACCNDLSGVTIRGSLLAKRFETIRREEPVRPRGSPDSLCLACNFPFR